MSDFLEQMAAVARQRVEMLDADARIDLERLAEAADPPRPLRPGLDGFDVIAEIKPSSPSEGVLMADRAGRGGVLDLAELYAASGACAISVLTEETRFGGSLDDLESVARTVPIPVMRKDFVVDPIQVWEARARGASGVLLIARLLGADRLPAITDLVLELGMFALIELFDEGDLETAATVFDRDVLLGVNARDLESLDVDTSRFGALAPRLPGHLPAVAESGLIGPEDVSAVADLGYRMALIGSSLVKSVDPVISLRRMVAAGRAAVSESVG